MQCFAIFVNPLICFSSDFSVNLCQRNYLITLTLLGQCRSGGEL